MDDLCLHMFTHCFYKGSLKQDQTNGTMERDNIP